MSWEETIAFCYLQQAHDEKNKCLLTNEHLAIIYRGSITRFELKQIKEVGFNQRRWLLPLIAGGITAPFALLAIFLNLYDLWPLFILFIMAVLMFYLGWMDHPVLTVRDHVREHDFSLSYVSGNLSAFVNFTNQYLHQGNEMIYHIARAEDWALAQQKKNYEAFSLKEKGFIHGSTQHQLNRLKQSTIFAPGQSWVLLVINPLKVHAEIRFEPGDDSPEFVSASEELFPHIYGPLNLDAVVRAELLFRNS